jgi:hypothetical protein
MQVSKTTVHLTLPALPRVRFTGLPLPLTVAICTFCLIAIAALAGRIASTPAVVLQPTPALVQPVIVIQKEPAAIPIAAPAQQVAQPAPVRMVVAFASPDGVALGPIPAPVLSAITGRWGDTWVSTTWQGATVWVRVSELGANLANLAPAPAAQPAAPAYVAAPVAPVVEQPVYQVSNEPQNAPQPPQQPVQEAQPVVVPLAPAPAPAAAPAPQAGMDTDVTRAWARTQWESEHCTAGKCVP